MATARDFRGTKLELGLALSEKPRTLYEAGKALGKPSGAIQRSLQRMVADGTVLAGADPPTRGTLYRLAPGALSALEEAAAGAHQPGVLVRNQRLLSVRGGPGRVALMELLARPALSGAVAWSARTDPAGGVLLAMNPDASDLQVDKLAVTLTRAGFELHEGAVGEIVSGRELRAQARSLSEELEAPL